MHQQIKAIGFLYIYADNVDRQLRFDNWALLLSIVCYLEVKEPSYDIWPQTILDRTGKTYKEQFRYNKKFELQEQILIDYLKKNIIITSSLTVLEVGCGFGRITKLLLQNFPNIREYLAVDLSPHQIENAKQYIVYQQQW